MDNIYYQIFIGTKNKRKLKAIRDAFFLAGYFVEVTGIDIESGVPEQPFEKQISQGAINRCCGLEKHPDVIKHLKELDDIDEPYKVLYVGIESGIKRDIRHGGYYDITTIAILHDFGKHNVRLLYTEPVYIFSRYEYLVEKTLSDKQETTFGKLFAQHVKEKYGISIDDDNWYSHMRGVPIDRYDILKNTIRKSIISRAHSI